jgi:hypothetical protein
MEHACLQVVVKCRRCREDLASVRDIGQPTNDGRVLVERTELRYQQRSEGAVEANARYGIRGEIDTQGVVALQDAKGKIAVWCERHGVLEIWSSPRITDGVGVV